MASVGLVGRGEELAMIRAALDDGDSRTLVLAGAAGVGKTRLAREAFAEAGRSGGATHWVAGSAATEAIPFGAVAHLVPNVDAGADRFAVLKAVTGALAADSRRQVVCVDDAHQLDQASAALVYHLAMSATAFVVATVRTGEPSPAQIDALWRDGLGERIELQPLTRPEAAALVTTLLGGPVDGVSEERLWLLTNGNAMYLRELVIDGSATRAWVRRDGAWTWRGQLAPPGRIVDLIADRVDRQSAPVRELIDLVAFGEPLGVTLLEAAGVSAATIEQAEHSGLVRTEVARHDVLVRPAHPLFGEVARARSSRLRRREVNRTLAQAAGFDGAEGVLRTAVWHLDGGVAVDAGLLLTSAGRALGALDLPLAQRLAAAAVDAGGGVHADLLLGVALVLCGRFDEAESHLAGVMAGDLPDPLRAELAAVRAWNLSNGLLLQDEAEAVLCETMAVLNECHEVLIGLRAHLSVTRGRPGDACALASEVLGVSPAPTDDNLLRALVARCQAWSVRGQYARCADDGQQAEAVYARLHRSAWTQTREELTSAIWCGLFYSGELGAAEEVADRELALKQSAGWRVGAEWWTVLKGAVLLGRGAVHSAWDLYRAGAGLVTDDTHPHQRFTSRLLALHHATAAAMVGQVADAEACLARADALAGPEIGVTDVWGGRAHAWVAAARGDVRGAIELALGAADRARADEQFGWEILARHQVVRFGAPERVVDRLVELDGLVDGRLAPLYAAHATALARRDVAALVEVGAGFADLGYQLLAAETFAQAAGSDRGRHAGLAATAAARGWELASRCEGAHTPALILLCEPAARLTRRESEIARLAAGGSTSREIADRLVVSVRTVDNTLYKVYAKLGIDSRDGLGAHVR